MEEIYNKKYQNFYLNDDNIICGIETPKDIWKIRNPGELKNLYIEKIDKLEKLVKQLGNYQPVKIELERVKKSLNKLNHAIEKLDKLEKEITE
jgi:recombinational DNA repair protein RecR